MSSPPRRGGPAGRGAGAGVPAPASPASAASPVDAAAAAAAGGPVSPAAASENIDADEMDRAEEESEGEDLLDEDNYAADYEARPELDQYEAEGLDEEDQHDEIDPLARARAEARMAKRDRESRIKGGREGRAMDSPLEDEAVRSRSSTRFETQASVFPLCCCRPFALVRSLSSVFVVFHFSLLSLFPERSRAQASSCARWSRDSYLRRRWFAGGRWSHGGRGSSNQFGQLSGTAQRVDRAGIDETRDQEAVQTVPHGVSRNGWSDAKASTERERDCCLLDSCCSHSRCCSVSLPQASKSPWQSTPLAWFKWVVRTVQVSK